MADNDDQRRGGDAGRGKRSVLRRGISAVASAGRAMLPSSSSSRPPPPLTQEDIGQMSVEELIALVDDDERMLELIQHKGLIRKLTSQIFAFTNEGSLLPNKDQAANDDFSEELTQRIADLQRSTTIWEPSSSSSRPTSLTPEVISQMSAEEVIALVNDDEQMLELIQDDELLEVLQDRITSLSKDNRLLPGKSKKENRKRKQELLERIADLRRSATIWDHFAQDPATIETKRIFSTTSKRNRQDVENEDEEDREDEEDCEDEEDREDSFDDRAKRVAVSQSAAESSAQREKPKGRKAQTSQMSKATTEVPEYFMPLYAEGWEIEKDPESDAAIELFSRKRNMFTGKYYALRNRSYDCFPESEVHGYMMKILGYILDVGMTDVLSDIITVGENQNVEIDTKMEAAIQVAGSIYHRRVDVQISVTDVNKEEEIRKQLRDENNTRGKRREELSAELNTLLTKAMMTMLECKTPETLKERPIDLINRFYVKEWAPRNKEVAKKENPAKYEGFQQAIETTKVKKLPPRAAKRRSLVVRTIKSPVAQLCLYMVSTAVNFGALTNGPQTYFFRRDSKNRTVKVSEAFYSNRNDNEGRSNPGNWSLGQAWLVFLYRALKDHNPTRRNMNLEWLKDGSDDTKTVVDTIIKGDVNVSVQERSSEGSSSTSTNNSTSRNGNSTRARRSRNRGPQRNAAVFAAFRLGPNLETPNMRTVLGGKAVGYPDIMINGVSSFVKTTYALHDSAYALGHEGQVYAALHALQGDVVPRVTACGLDETLNLVVFATEQCGKSLCDLHTQELEEYGGLEELYWKAALALDKIHKAGFIHGDVALRNIVVDDASNVKFIDLERSKKSRSEALREEDFNLLAEAFGIDSAKDFRTLSRTNNTEAHLENNEIV